jgi:hypothetical protein
LLVAVVAVDIVQVAVVVQVVLSKYQGSLLFLAYLIL